VNTKVFTFLILSFAAAAFSEDFKTVNGKEYKEATITRIEPDGIVVKTKLGITKLPFAELPKEVQERFHYDPQKAGAYVADQSANYAEYQQRQEDARRRQQDEAAKNKAVAAEQQAITNRIQALQARYAELQKHEEDLLLRIGETKQPGPAYHVGKKLQHQPNPQKSQLPLLQSELSDIRREKTEVRRQLAKAQR
jgi:chromosome segregation ATPase